MKYLCLAYGDEKDWNVLTKKEQDALLAQDEALRKRGVLMALVQTTVTTVRAWEGKPAASDGAFANSQVPLAGFSIIEAADLNEGIQLVTRDAMRAREGSDRNKADHADRSYNTSCRNQRPRLFLWLAGFQVTLIGRFWLTREGNGCHGLIITGQLNRRANFHRSFHAPSLVLN